ncbi:MAG TPA: hypothetical protein VNM14_06320 [Planctomycetota bacterium]|jgi:hypothetical protein|nr:hypothetical protein [Planctomycetota bacterium]
MLTIPALALLLAVPAQGDLVGVWNFKEAKDGVVRNERPQGGGVPAVLRDFDPKVLAGVDVEPADFSVSRTGLRTSVRVAKSGWATFAGIPDNGLEDGVRTPVGPQALAVYSDKPGNWVHFPGLATELVGRPGGSLRSFGWAAWFLLQTEGDPPQFGHKGVNALFRFSSTDGRLQTFAAIDRFVSEDVGNGLGPGHTFRLLPAQKEAAAARWVHLVLSADGPAEKVQMWVNGQAVEYATGTSGRDAYPWPAGGGLQITYKLGHDSDGMSIGRWLGGYAASGRTFGLASVVIVKNEPIDQKRARSLYELGRRGIPFDGVWK